MCIDAGRVDRCHGNEFLRGECEAKASARATTEWYERVRMRVLVVGVAVDPSSRLDAVRLEKLLGEMVGDMG